MKSELKVDVPEGNSGDWEVRKIIVTEEQSKLDMLRGLFNYHGRYTPAGAYTQLLRGKTIVMSDTPNEIDDHWGIIHHAKGEVLINGLGLGVVLKGILSKPEVTKVTVIELSEDVIKLVGAYYKSQYGEKLEIINANALTWKPPKGKRYGAVWHDIWDTICSDNLPDMHKLHRKYARIAGWQGSWCRYQCEK